MTEKTLQLTLMKGWFDQIEAGTKTVEYREIKPYWTKRLVLPNGNPKQYDSVFFRNGYSPDCRKMKVEFKALRTNVESKEYEILLGNVLWSGR